MTFKHWATMLNITFPYMNHTFRVRKLKFGVWIQLTGFWILSIRFFEVVRFLKVSGLIIFYERQNFFARFLWSLNERKCKLLKIKPFKNNPKSMMVPMAKAWNFRNYVNYYSFISIFFINAQKTWWNLYSKACALRCYFFYSRQ